MYVSIGCTEDSFNLQWLYVPIVIRRFLPQLAQSALMKALEDANIRPSENVNKPVEAIHCKNMHVYMCVHYVCMYVGTYVCTCTCFEFCLVISMLCSYFVYLFDVAHPCHTPHQHLVPYMLYLSTFTMQHACFFLEKKPHAMVQLKKNVWHACWCGSIPVHAYG